MPGPRPWITALVNLTRYVPKIGECHAFELKHPWVSYVLTRGFSARSVGRNKKRRSNQDWRELDHRG